MTRRSLIAALALLASCRPCPPCKPRVVIQSVTINASRASLALAEHLGDAFRDSGWAVKVWHDEKGISPGVRVEADPAFAAPARDFVRALRADGVAGVSDPVIRESDRAFVIYVGPPA